MEPITRMTGSAADRYVLGAELGRGGMGVVHRAVDRATGRPVALKRLDAGHAGDAAFRARFAREARAMARIRHPNVVGIHAGGEDGDGPWFAMDLCGGGSLADRLRQGPLPAADARAVAGDVLAALSAIHATGLIHRDLKPQNILRDGARWRVSDFGIARDTTGATTMTQAGMIIGTPDYLAPEHIGEGPVRPEADLYALGAVLHHALTGAPPYRADSALRLAMMHATAPAPVLPLEVRAADPALAALVDDLLRKDPAARPTVAEARQRLLDGDGTPTVIAAAAAAPGAIAAAGAAGSTAMLPRPRRRVRARHAVAAALGAATLALGAAWIAGDDAPDDPDGARPATAPATTRTVTAPAVPAPVAPAPVPAAAPVDERDDGDDRESTEDDEGARGDRPGNNSRGKAKGPDKKPRKPPKAKKGGRG
jgi:serine/threonine-protein kinase